LVGFEFPINFVCLWPRGSEFVCVSSLHLAMHVLNPLGPLQCDAVRLTHRNTARSLHSTHAVLTVPSLFPCVLLAPQWQLAKRNMKAAVYKRFSYLAGKCFFAWSNYVYMVALGLDRKRWPGPRKYEVCFVTAWGFVGVYPVMRATRVAFDTLCPSWQCGASEIVAESLIWSSVPGVRFILLAVCIWRLCLNDVSRTNIQ
jgi:hypothetical protein